MRVHTFRERHGFRAFWHFRHPNQLVVEGYWWSRSCHVRIGVDDEGWDVSLALPPLALYLSCQFARLWRPLVAHEVHFGPHGPLPPGETRTIHLTDQRECRIAIHDWKLWVTPWGRSMEWRAKDPWWVRGVTLDFKDLLAGRWVYRCETLREGIPVVIPMPEGTYKGVAKVERQVWKRPRWVRQERVSTWIDIPKGIPYAGKGENSWDCDDDGLFGTGADGEDLQAAIAHVQQSVFERRRQYGHASAETIRDALAD